MKVLTISQPYASLIASGEKWIENRRWHTNYRGPLVIHAGKGTQYMTRAEMREQSLPIGSVVAVCRMQDCVELSKAADRVRRHQHAEGPFCWVLGDVVKLETPIELVGKQGLFKPSDELVDALGQRVALARFMRGSK